MNHTRKLQMILTFVVAAAAIAAAPALPRAATRAAADSADPSLGAWELLGAGVGTREVKLITASRFSWTTWDTATHRMLSCGGGAREVHGDHGIERLDYSRGPLVDSLATVPLEFRVEVRGDTLIQRGVEGGRMPWLREVWLRIP